MLLLTALSLVPVHAFPPQDSRDGEVALEDEAFEDLPPLMQLRRELQLEAERDLAGAWQLESLMIDGLDAPPGEISGHALFGDGLGALLMHSIGWDEANQEEAPTAQALIFRYRVDEFGALQTSTIIGHSNPFGGIEYELNGVLREYQIDLDDPFLSLRHQSGMVVGFSRVIDEALEIGSFERLARRATAGVEEDEDGEEVEEGAAEERSLNAFLEYRQERLALLQEGIVGSWRLVAYRQGGEEVPPGEISALAIFQGDYLALVIHALGYDESNEEEVALAQAGVFRYRLDEFGTLVTSTISGHSNPYGEVEWELGGELREYHVEYQGVQSDALGLREAGGEALILRHSTGTTMRFARARDRGLSEREIERLNKIRGLGYDPRGGIDAAVEPR